MSGVGKTWQVRLLSPVELATAYNTCCWPACGGESYDPGTLPLCGRHLRKAYLAACDAIQVQRDERHSERHEPPA